MVPGVDFCEQPLISDSFFSAKRSIDNAILQRDSSFLEGIEEAIKENIARHRTYDDSPQDLAVESEGHMVFQQLADAHFHLGDRTKARELAGVYGLTLPDDSAEKK